MGISLQLHGAKTPTRICSGWWFPLSYPGNGDVWNTTKSMIVLGVWMEWDSIQSCWGQQVSLSTSMNQFLAPLGPLHTFSSTVSLLSHILGSRGIFSFGSALLRCGCGSFSMAVLCRLEGTGSYCCAGKPKDHTTTRAVWPSSLTSYKLKSWKRNREDFFFFFLIFYFLASHLFLFASSTNILIKVITLDQVSVVACCLSNGFSSVISLLGFGMTWWEPGGKQQKVGAGRREDTAVLKAEGSQRLLHPAWDCQGFQIIKGTALFPSPQFFFSLFLPQQKHSLLIRDTVHLGICMDSLSMVSQLRSFHHCKILHKVLLRDWWELVWRAFERGNGEKVAGGAVLSLKIQFGVLVCAWSREPRKQNQKNQ